MAANGVAVGAAERVRGFPSHDVLLHIPNAAFGVGLLIEAQLDLKGLFTKNRRPFLEQHETKIRGHFYCG
jgi:hypothetical protein